MTHFFLIISIFFALLLSSCASLTTLDSGRNIGKGNFGGAIALSSNKGLSPNRGYYNGNDTIPRTASFAEFNFIYGVGKRTDINVRVGALSIPSVGLKHQFYGTNDTKWASSIGLNVGYINVNSSYYRTHFVNISVPLYLSCLISDKFTVYAVPKYIYDNRLFYTSSPFDVSTANLTKWAPHHLGTSIGLKIGKKSGVLLEYSVAKSSEVRKPTMQVALGIFY